MRRAGWLIVACCCAGIFPPAQDAHAAGTDASVVRIVNSSQHGDWYSPWDVTRVAELTGSGFVIDGGLVMTNAHVVSDSRLLLIQVRNDPEPHVAEIVFIAHDSDLALIRPTDPEALATIKPLRFGRPPELGSTVDTIGYPAGGLQVSSTRGVVSRIEDQLYVHSGKDSHLTVQTDAAINPGNSGGPVVQRGRVVGVAFQASLDLESVGFFIPLEVIHRFLDDVSDGHYDGYPELGAITSSLQNPAARTRAQLDPGETGVRVDRVYGGTSATGILRPGDVLLSVDGRLVGNDGSVPDDGRRIPFGLLVDRMQIGDNLAVRVMRGGERVGLTVPLADFPAVASQGHVYDQHPRYLIYGGLVFVPINRETMQTYGSSWRQDADKELLHEYFMRPLFDPDAYLHPRVLLLRRLAHPVNADMAWYRNEVVDRVDGRTINSLAELAETLDSFTGKFHLIEFAHHGRFAVLDREKAEQARDEIREHYGIREDRHL
ncbi:MAG: PDZ domain-containing protein [Acidobacteriota bacterium]